MGLSAAIFVNKEFKGRNFVRLILYMPIMISGVIMGAIQYYIFNYENGVLNNILNLFGVGNIYWMETGPRAVMIITLINSWQAMGFCMLISSGGSAEYSQNVSGSCFTGRSDKTADLL
ncbi:MAG: carbohydrate ABC transporter permease [Lachnospiraceae bacterium]